MLKIHAIFVSIEKFRPWPVIVAGGIFREIAKSFNQTLCYSLKSEITTLGTTFLHLQLSLHSNKVNICSQDVSMATTSTDIVNGCDE